MLPHICHLFYTTAFWGQEILRLEGRKFATKLCVKQVFYTWLICFTQLAVVMVVKKFMCAQNLLIFHKIRTTGSYSHNVNNFDLRWKYGNFLNLLLERIMQTVFIAFKSDRIGAILYFKPFPPIAYHFTTTYSIHKHPVILRRKSKTSNIT